MRDYRAASRRFIDEIDLVLRIDGADRDAVHAPREQNSAADEMSNRAIDERM